MKICKQCSNSFTGVRCKPCQKLAIQRWKQANKERTYTTNRVYQTNNKEKVAKYRATWEEKNKEMKVDINRKWREGNRGYVNADKATRRANKLKATPTWANNMVILTYYNLAKRLSTCLGIPHQVDHILPLNGRLVSGLHVENNLQVLPATINLKKGNRI